MMLHMDEPFIGPQESSAVRDFGSSANPLYHIEDETRLRIAARTSLNIIENQHTLCILVA